MMDNEKERVVNKKPKGPPKDKPSQRGGAKKKVSVITGTSLRRG